MRDPTVPLGDAAAASGESTAVAGTLALRPRHGDGDAPVEADDATRLLGRILAGRYEVRAVLGRGGMGIVYEGRHITVGRPVAVKVLRRDLARSAQAVARFHREAQAAASIGSEHIVEVFDFGYSEEGDAFLVMELLAGEDLGRLLRRVGTLPESRAVALARQIARALQAAHAKGIIHRDLKSENVFVLQREGRDFVKLLDFGISKVLEGDARSGPTTTEGAVMGTPHYMAPEQATSELEPDPRLDLYALGCILYEMLTGRVPFTGKSPVEVVFKHVHEAPVPPSHLCGGPLSPAVEAVILRALAKSREARFADAAAMLAALDATSPSRPPGAPSDAVTGASRAVRRAWVLAGAAVGAVGVALAARWGRRAPPREPVSGVRAAVVDTAAGRSVRDGGGLALGADRSGASAAVIEAEREGTLQITVVPAGAAIAVDGQGRGSGAARLRFERGSRHRVHLVASGYASVDDDVVVGASTVRSYRLVRLAAVAPDVIVRDPAPDPGAQSTQTPPEPATGRASLESLLRGMPERYRADSGP